MITDRQIKLVIGSLLHDIRKVVYRSGDGRNHSQSGYEYLKTEAKIFDQNILNCVRFHHGKNLRTAQVADDDLSYLTYYADNIAAFTDRREAEEGEGGFDKTVPLDSVFNILNGNHEKKHYAMQVLDPHAGINYPTDQPVSMDEHFYKTVIQNITECLRGIELDEKYLNSLLSVLEANLSYIPSSTSKKELTDISLYDHIKMTAAIAACTEQYLEEKQERNYKKLLFENAKQSYEEKMFLLYSMDISGIQNFIYTVGESGVLKGLRARSFYLEIMMEHVVDELLEKLALSRANLIYTGGGHCYMLLPNTEHVKNEIADYEKELNAWMMRQFDTALYVASGYAPVSANELRDEPEGSYSGLYLKISKMIAGKKSHRYDADMIRSLNKKRHSGERECKVCRRMAELTDDKCGMCNALEKMSGNILHDPYFTVVIGKEKNALPLPGEKYLVADTKESLLKRMQQDGYVRSYTKNDFYTGNQVATKLWVGDYATEDTFEGFAQKAEGIERIGVLRADVDNLGTTFVYGFQRPDGSHKYVTLSRTATLSRQLSLFFKCYINSLLREDEAGIFAGKGKRNAAIVYSGGDDVFLVGAWNEVIAAFQELKNALARFAQGTLTISGGIGVYPEKYPLNVMAKEVERLEDASKQNDGKNAITVLDESHVYPWDEFQKKVVEEKVKTLKWYFEQTEERGMSFLYHLTELLRNSEEHINIARYAYLLSRMEPDKDSSREEKEAYQIFSRKMYEWGNDAREKRELITAIYLYVYLKRDKEEQK